MTLVSHDHRFIFLKTRKTAGTSVEMYLQPFCTPPGTPVEEWGEAIISDHGIVGQRLGRTGRSAPPPPGAVRDTWYSHHAAEDLKAQLPPKVWRRYEKITVVRNPFAKVLSGFFWRNRGQTLSDHPDQLIPRFRKSVRDGNVSDDRKIVFVRGWLRRDKFVPDTVLHAERLGPDLARLTERLGLESSRTSLPVTKSSGNKARVLPLTEWYDDETADIVRDRLDWMFRAGGYSREVPE
ncbi:sulfotransferase family 2 domain-containing protein [Tropicibacter alexandrii]|uniref:sulfotransferase family 2 domain-containing protein n=1 Tax=Tropicibacter alexandrii TaxID=2267683 RepID=UPI000EF4F9EB|nr:sulfotransferase family 2 domain-containing protein [Tropicibacter alexandrii]